MSLFKETPYHLKDHGTDTFCPKHIGGVGHKPDWGTVSMEQDGGGVYIDVSCMHCGRSGCLGALKQVESKIDW